VLSKIIHLSRGGSTDGKASDVLYRSEIRLIKQRPALTCDTGGSGGCGFREHCVFRDRLDASQISQPGNAIGKVDLCFFGPEQPPNREAEQQVTTTQNAGKPPGISAPETSAAEMPLTPDRAKAAGGVGLPATGWIPLPESASAPFPARSPLNPG
jgi:hypothetical protein